MKSSIQMSIKALSVVTMLVVGMSQASAQATAWADRISLGGDFKFREERLDNESQTDAKQVWRNAIRARLTASGKVNDQVQVNFRLTSSGANGGNNDANSSDQVIGQGGPNKKAFDLDMAYFDYKPMEHLVLSAGKAPNPFWTAGRNEMLWDADLTFEGGSAKWASDMGPVKSFANVTADNFNQRQTGAGATNAGDASMFGAQVGGSMSFAERFSGTVSLGYYSFNHMKGYQELFAGNAYGNSVTGPAATASYTSGFHLLDVGLEFGMDVLAGMPFAFYANYIDNTDAVAPVGGDKGATAWLVGFRVGALKDVHSWEFNYNYRDVGANAVIGGLNDSNFAGSNADVKGHRIGALYQLWPNTNVGLSQSIATLNHKTAKQSYDRTQLDFNFMF